MEKASIPQLLMPLMGSEDVQNMLKFACTLRSGALLLQLLRVRYGQVFGDIHSFGTACRAQAWACLSTGPRLTVVFLTFSVLAQEKGGVHPFHWVRFLRFLVADFFVSFCLEVCGQGPKCSPKSMACCLGYNQKEGVVILG